MKSSVQHPSALQRIVVSCGMINDTVASFTRGGLVAERGHVGVLCEERRQPVRRDDDADCCAAHRSDITPPSAMSWSACASMVVSRRQQVRIPP